MTPPIESPTMIRPNDFIMADGDLDSSFGTGGLAQRPQVSGFESIGDSVMQPDLKIVAVGESDEKIARARHISSTSSPNATCSRRKSSR